MQVCGNMLVFKWVQMYFSECKIKSLHFKHRGQRKAVQPRQTEHLQTEYGQQAGCWC